MSSSQGSIYNPGGRARSPTPSFASRQSKTIAGHCLLDTWHGPDNEGGDDNEVEFLGSQTRKETPSPRVPTKAKKDRGAGMRRRLTVSTLKRGDIPTKEKAGVIKSQTMLQGLAEVSDHDFVDINTIQ